MPEMNKAARRTYSLVVSDQEFYDLKEEECLKGEQFILPMIAKQEVCEIKLPT